jgi:23S rRNA pseudouridine1911/1915/1917 synthase
MAAMRDDQAMTAASWSVTGQHANMRLDAFARRCLPHLSRRAIARAIQQNEIWINGSPAEKGAKVAEGDVMTFHGPASLLCDRPTAAEQLFFPIVYEDDSLLIIDKPAGIATHGFSGADKDTVANFIAAVRPEILTVGKNRWEPGLVHRLDRGTSGLLIVAKTQFAFDRLRAEFSARQVRKKYQALVCGVAPEAGSIPYSLAHDAKNPGRMVVVMDNSPLRAGRKVWRALTRFRRLKVFDETSLVEAEMESGVTHQIRVHLAAIGHPIVGDTIYGERNAEMFGLERHFLHASSLEFSHPVQLRRIRIESALTAELETVLAGLTLVPAPGSADDRK